MESFGPEEYDKCLLYFADKPKERNLFASLIGVIIGQRGKLYDIL